MSTGGKLAQGAGLALAAFVLTACGPEFDPPSELRSLRILAVQKDEPYAKPGDTVNLTMLWQDASPKRLDASGKPRAIQIAWASGCINPPGDLYFGCFSRLSMAGLGPTFSVVIPPTDIIHPSNDPKQPPYGLEYVFFSACAGTLTQVTPTEDSPLPFACQDTSTGALLGPDDFVAGYTQIYVFDAFTNENPVLTNAAGAAQITFAGQTFPADCVDAACLTVPDPVDPCADPAKAALCVPVCADDGDAKKCPQHALQPVIDQTLPQNSEPDSIAVLSYGRAYGEEMWLDYYADRGNFDPALKLFSDAQSGYNPSYATHFLAPKDPGPVRVWAVLHDNRGGVSWEGFTLGAK
jgi:hypothetical protein